MQHPWKGGEGVTSTLSTISPPPAGTSPRWTEHPISWVQAARVPMRLYRWCLIWGRGRRKTGMCCVSPVEWYFSL